MATSKAVQSLAVNFSNTNKFEDPAESTKPSEMTTAVPEDTNTNKGGQSKDNGSGSEDEMSSSEEETGSSHYESDNDSDNGGPVWVGGIPRAPPTHTVKGTLSKNAHAPPSNSTKRDAEKQKEKKAATSSKNPATKNNNPVSGNGKYNPAPKNGK